MKLPSLFEFFRRRDQDASDRDRQRYKNQLDLTGSEKGQLEKLRLQLTEQIDNVTAECDKLKQANTELQSKRDSLEDEKEDVVKDKDRQVKENQRW